MARDKSTMGAFVVGEARNQLVWRGREMCLDEAVCTLDIVGVLGGLVGTVECNTCISYNMLLRMDYLFDP